MSRPISEAELPAVETIRCIYTPEFVFAEWRPPGRALTSLEKERRELLDSLLRALKAPDPDADCVAVCGALLRHLAKAGRPL